MYHFGYAELIRNPFDRIGGPWTNSVDQRGRTAYRRSDLFKRRRRLMDDWARYLAGGSRKP